MFDARDSRNDFARPSWILAMLVFFILLMPFVRSYFFNSLGRWLYVLIFSFSASYILTPVARKIASKFGILDFVEDAGGRSPLMPTPQEVERNPRARSAKLRIVEKIT